MIIYLNNYTKKFQKPWLEIYLNAFSEYSNNFYGINCFLLILNFKNVYNKITGRFSHCEHLNRDGTTGLKFFGKNILLCSFKIF